MVAAAVSPGEPPCSHVLEQTQTNKNGRFELAAVQKTYRVTWIYPGDVFPPQYLVCVSVADTLRPAYEGRGSLSDSFENDSLDCIEWFWRDRTRVTCSSQTNNAVTSGGAWSDSTTTGYFRLIVTGDDGPLGYTGLVMRPRAYIQWVAGAAGSSRQVVRTSLAMPWLPDGYAFNQPRIEPLSGGGWCASIRVRTERRLLGYKQERFAVRMGPPGELQQMHDASQCGHRS